MGWIKSLFFKSERVKRVAERLDPVHVPGERKLGSVDYVVGILCQTTKWQSRMGVIFIRLVGKQG